MILRPLAAACALASLASLSLADTPSPSGLSGANMDSSVAACQDFYQFANGNWLKTNPVPSAYPSWGTFDEIEKRNNVRLGVIAERAAANSDAADGSPEDLVGDFYASYLDAERIEKAGLKPIAADLKRIDELRRPREVRALIAEWHAQGMPALFALGVRQDLKDPTRVIAYAGQGGLGLPNRDYYVKQDAETVAMRAAYASHIARTLALAGITETQATRQATLILGLESKLAAASLTREVLRDPNKSYNVISVAAADQQMKQFEWRGYFDALGLKRVEDFSFSHPQFFKAMDTALKAESMDTWRAYLRFNLLRQMSPQLSQAFVDENFGFYGRTLRGQQELKPRNIRAIEQINQSMGQTLGQLFVAEHFPPEAKARMLKLVGNLKVALRDRLEALPWMGEDTKRQALEKWATFTPKIGYPDKWRDFSSLRFNRENYLSNVRQLGAFNQSFELAKIGLPIDKSAWSMPPQQVNAYYNAVWNEVVFPAGILQPPFFDLAADDALNYGAIGAVIGHELLHGFDDSGSRFDAQGRLKMWWTPTDRQEFDKRTERLVTQAAEYLPLPNLRLNGRTSLGENIADLGGLQVAFAALERAQGTSKPADIDGFSAPQRFFLSWAQVWRRNSTDAAMRVQINTAPHAPGKFRTNGPLANLPEFATTFNCKPQDPMVRRGDKQVVIW